MKRLTITIAMLVAAAVAAPTADASSRQLMIMQDDAHVRSTPSATVAEMAGYGTDVVKINLYWDEVESTRSSFNWGSYDAAVNAIVAQGLQPYLSIGGHAPKWATGKHGRPGDEPAQRQGVPRSSPRPPASTYPDVHIWSIWNEPNLVLVAGPQRSHGTPLSPSIYRNLYLARLPRAEGEAGHGGDTILLGELMPRGGTSAHEGAPARVPARDGLPGPPLPPDPRQGRQEARLPQGGPLPHLGHRLPPLHAAGRAAHAAEGTDDAAIGQLSRLRATIDALARRGKLPRHLPIWITEFGYQTKPPDPFQGAPLKRAASFMDESEWIAFRNPRVASYSQYTLFDDPPRPGPGVLRWSSVAGGHLLRQRQAQAVRVQRVPPAGVRPQAQRATAWRSSAGAGPPGETARSRPRRRAGATARSARSHVNQAGYFRRVFKVKSRLAQHTGSRSMASRVSSSLVSVTSAPPGC